MTQEHLLFYKVNKKTCNKQYFNEIIFTENKKI